VVTAEIGLGVLAGTGFITLQPDNAKDHFTRYADYGPAVVILTVRNTGAIKASVATHKIRFDPAGVMLQMLDEFPYYDPRLNRRGSDTVPRSSDPARYRPTP
jgi:hypothetical protein